MWSDVVQKVTASSEHTKSSVIVNTPGFIDTYGRDILYDEYQHCDETLTRHSV